jgi:ribosomal protein S18 acetylase RimI-like enzyme
VDEETPELVIGVVARRRGRGGGEALLDARLERAMAEGHSALSLSVPRDDDALCRFYEKHGFARVGEDGDTVTMRREL